MRGSPIFAACYFYTLLLLCAVSSNLPVTYGFAATSFEPVCFYREVSIVPDNNDAGDNEVLPQQLVSVQDLTPTIEALITESGVQHGTVTVISRHTTTAITINELESRLQRDIAKTFLQLIPPDERSLSSQRQQGIRYEHNDIDQRPESAAEAERCRENGWNVDDIASLQAWRDQEPINAHAHLLSMLLGSSESIPIVERKMVIGQWQSVLLIDLDGPRKRTVGLQVMGFR